MAAANPGRAIRAPAAASKRFCRAACSHFACQPDQPRIRPWLPMRAAAFLWSCSTRASFCASARAATCSSTEPVNSVRSRTSAAFCFSVATASWRAISALSSVTSSSRPLHLSWCFFCCLSLSLRRCSNVPFAAFTPSPCQSARQCATAAANPGRAIRAPAAASMRFSRAASDHLSCQPDQPRIRPWLPMRAAAFLWSCSTRFSLSASARAAACCSTEPVSSIRSRSSSVSCFFFTALICTSASARASSRSRSSLASKALMRAFPTSSCCAKPIVASPCQSVLQ
eukprot:scaffold55086_cov64-Phaeocystis_antarctica.AAC.8